MNKNPIHFSDAEKQAHETSKTTEAVNVARETLSKDLQDKATSSDVQEVVQAIKDIPETVVPDMSDKLDEVVKAVKSIPKTVIPPPKDFPKIPEFPSKMKVELEGISVLTIKGDKGDDGKDADEEKIIHEVFKKIPIPRNGADGRSPLTVSKTAPKNPKKGDLWYQD